MNSQYKNPDNDPNGPWVPTDVTTMGERTGTSFEWNGRRPPLGRSWKFSEDRAKELERQGMISFSSTGMPRMKRYLKESSQVLQREFEQLPHKKFKFETELIASITPTLTSALGYSEEEIFFDYGRRNYRADFVVSESIESKPWVIFEVKNRRTQDTSSWIEQLQSYLTEFNVKKGVLISPEKLIVISEGIVKQFDLNNITFAETLEIVQSIARSDEDTSLPTEKSVGNQLTKLIEQAESATTNDAKGKSLEALARHLLTSVPSLKSKYANLHTRSSEIDIVVEYDSSEGRLPLFEDLGRYCFVECKNWSEPVGAKHIRDFIGKLEKCRVKLGIVFAKNGVTGTNSGLDALREISSAYDRNGSVVLIFSLGDLRSINDGAAFSEALDIRYDRLRFDIDG
jgi:hypothetical protein